MNPLRFLFGPQAGMAMMGDGRPDNSQADMSALTKMLAEVRAKNGTPNGRVARGFDQFGPQMYPDAPTWGSGVPEDTATSPPQPAADTPPPALTQEQFAAAPMPTPMPAPRPPEAPQPPPEMGFFQRNSAMMQDPTNMGSFIDPEAAARANASGPDVIQKLLNMFHQKA